jgi:hypothetical protein
MFKASPTDELRKTMMADLGSVQTTTTQAPVTLKPITEMRPIDKGVYDWAVANLGSKSEARRVKANKAIAKLKLTYNITDY